MNKACIKETEITVEAAAGAVLYECEIAAMILALERYVLVTLIHNGNRYTMDPGKALTAQVGGRKKKEESNEG